MSGVAPAAPSGGLPRGVSWAEPAPGLSYGRIYYYVPAGLDLSKRPGLFIFMHGGGGETDTQPEKVFGSAQVMRGDGSMFFASLWLQYSYDEQGRCVHGSETGRTYIIRTHLWGATCRVLHKLPHVSFPEFE